MEEADGAKQNPTPLFALSHPMPTLSEQDKPVPHVTLVDS